MTCHVYIVVLNSSIDNRVRTMSKICGECICKSYRIVSCNIIYISFINDYIAMTYSRPETFSFNKSVYCK